MGLATLFSNLPIVITVILLVVSVIMFFYFRQKISELEKASVSQAKVLHSFISQSLAMPRNFNPNIRLSDINESSMLLSNNTSSGGDQQLSSSYEHGSPKDKIIVSDEEDEYDSSEDDESEDDDSNSESSEESSDNENEIKSIKLKEIDDSDIDEHLDTSKIKKIFLNSNDESNLVPFEVHNLSSDPYKDGSCDSSNDELSNESDDSLSELSDNELDENGRVSNDDMSHKINVIKTNHDTNNNSTLNTLLTNLGKEQSSLSAVVDVSNLQIVKKSQSHNTSLKEKDEGNNELKALKVDTLRQLVIDKSLVNVDEAKKLKKKELVELLAQVEKKDNV